VSVGLRDQRFVRFSVTEGNLTLKIELVNDVRSRVGQVSIHPVLGRVDTAENILANKLTALACFGPSCIPHHENAPGSTAA